MTIQELIWKLQDYDPTALVCVAAPVRGLMLPASSEVYPPEEVIIGTDKYMCVMLTASSWP